MEGQRSRAIAFATLSGALRPGDEVFLNTTAVRLGLGTGGAHFVISRMGGDPDRDAATTGFPGRDAGHVLKLRYTPLQLRVLAAEEEASAHHASLRDFASLGGMPVLGAELHSQAAATAIAARAAAPCSRIALVQLDSAALPFSFSRLMARLRTEEVITATISVGQCFGGDHEAVNIYSGLAVAREVVGADLVIVTQGPGNTGTGTRYGFSGLALAEALHACDALGGVPVLVPRMSEGDSRGRHRGLSHHTRTLLEVLRVPVQVPFPVGTEPSHAVGRTRREGEAPHRFLSVPAPDLEFLQPYRQVLTTMGRDLVSDPLFFGAAAAAGYWAAVQARADTIAARSEPAP